MNTEKKLQINVFVRLLLVCVFALMYAWGGMEYKIIRRLLAPSFLCLLMFLYSKDKRAWLQLLPMYITLSIGYGGVSLIEKIQRRFLFGFLNGITSSTYNIILKNSLLSIIQISLLSFLYLTLGVWNPLPQARTEELVLGFMVAFIPLMSVKKYERTK
jgi:hypothetical protein